MSHAAEFRDAIAAAGLTPPGEIIGDGALHRFSSNGRPKDESGWYKFHDDERPAGAFGCWRTQMSSTWASTAERREFTDAEKQAWRERKQQTERERQAALQAQRAEAAALAADMWARATEQPHPYLTRKQITAMGVRVLNGELLIPLRHGPGPLVGLQRILPDGGKFFLSGTPAGGAYHVLGKPNTKGPIVICEGYATGASIHMATSWCVVVALNAGNLEPVAVKIRKALPDARMIIAADDDAWTDGNPGVTSACAAARAIGATVAVPVWGASRPDKATDFNDLHASDGLPEVEACLADPREPDELQKRALAHVERAQAAMNSIAPTSSGAEPIRAAAYRKPPVKPTSDGGDQTPANVGSSVGEFSPFAPDPAVDSPGQPRPSSHDVGGPGSDVAFVNGELDGDVFIYATTPLKTAEEFQARLPADGKVLFWRGEFYTWNGHRYAVRDVHYLHQLLYAFMAGAMTHKHNPKTGDNDIAAFSPKKSHIEDVMHALRAVCFIDLPEPPSWIEDHDDDCPPGEIVAFRNGFLHWPTRELWPSDPRLFVISALDFDYDPTATAPSEWLKFLSALWPTDPQSIEALADVFGYMLTDDTSQQKAFMMIGPPRCGKGTILRVLEHMVGQHNRVSPSLASLGTQFGLQPLVGKRLAMISDARLSGKTDQQPIVENILRITGEDSLSIDRKFLGSWSGKLPTRFIMASNETPAFSDASGALPNRFIMFKFTLSFLGREDHGLTARLLAELPGIVLWALDGLARLRARGYLIAPESGRELADEMREQSSPIGTFVAERCVVKHGAKVERGELFTAWKEWCISQGMDHPGTVVSFGRRLSAAVPGLGRAQPQENRTRSNCYTGLRLRNMMDFDE